MKNEAEFQTLVAKEIAKVEDPEEYIRSYEKNRTMVKLSLIMAGKSEGVIPPYFSLLTFLNKK